MRPPLKFPYAFLLIFIMSFMMMGCSSAETTEESILPESIPQMSADPSVIHILLTHTENTDSPTQRTAEFLSARLTQLSGGTMQISVYGDNSLGTLTDSSTSLALGTTQMRIGTAASPWTTLFRWLPTLADTDIPTMEAALKEGAPLRLAMEKDFLEKGYRLLGTLPISYRVITSNTPIQKMEDFKNLKMRTIFNGVESDFWSCLGAETSAFDVDKVYLALQRGYVNAQENTIPSILSNKFYEQQKYVTLIRHRVYMDQIYVNEDFYQSLTQKQQEWLQEAARLAIEHGIQEMTNDTDSGMTELAKAGLEVNEFPEKERDKMMEILRPYTYEALAATYGHEIIDQLIDLVQKQ